MNFVWVSKKTGVQVSGPSFRSRQNGVTALVQMHHDRKLSEWISEESDPPSSRNRGARFYSLQAMKGCSVSVGRNLVKESYLRLLILVCIIAFLVLLIPAATAKTAEASVSETLTRGGRFTVTITALPSTAYYIWLPGTSTMSGEPRDQPPVISDNVGNVEKDPPGGPFTIGSYQFSNGDGRTILEDVAPSTSSMSATNYYALVTTDSIGQGTVEFQTSVDTGLRSYSVRVENPRSVDSDTLQLRLQVFTRRAPVTQTPQLPSETTVTFVPVSSTMEVTVTTPPVPAQQTMPPTTAFQTQEPAAVPSRRAGLESGLAIVAAGIVLGLKRR